MKNSLYLHLPFCRSICPYCDFARTSYQSGLVDEYLGILCPSIPDEDFRTIYIGGGTPSCLTDLQLELLLKALYQRTSGEYSVEFNIADVNEKKLILLRSYGVNRISLGVQSFDESILRQCNRPSSQTAVIKAIELVKSYFTNYSIDLLYGLPQQSCASFLDDLRLAKQLQVPHLSLYGLTIEENSIWGKAKIKSPNQDLLADYYQLAYEYLRHDYQHYEISNFALPGYQAQHNLVYWQYQDYYGIGLGAASKLGNRRYSYTRNLSAYMSKQKLSEDIYLSQKQQMFEYLMMNLRLAQGINLAVFKDLFDYDFLEYYQEVINKKRDYLIVGENNLAIKQDFWYVSNSILVEFLTEEVM